MIAMHMDEILGWFNPHKDLTGTDWENVSARGKHISTAFFYIVFLGVALFHGLYGFRRIILELGVPRKGRQWLTAVLVIAWIVLFVDTRYLHPIN